MAMAGSLNFRVIFKSAFESNPPPGGFLQKDFPPDFYLVLCTLSSVSSRRILRNCFQIQRLGSYRHFQASALPISVCDLSWNQCTATHLSSYPILCWLIHYWYLPLFNSKRWSMAVAEHGAIRGHIVKSQLLLRSVLYDFHYFWENRCQPADTGCWVLASSNSQVIKILLKENIGCQL